MDLLIHDLGLELRPTVVALVLIAMTIMVARLVRLSIDRAVARERQRGRLEPGLLTRMVATRRLVNAVLWIIGISAAMAQFPELRVLGTGLLASAGVTTLVLGFAARGTLGNMMAGLFISFAQPLRVGDEVEIKSQTGVVEDITLLHTFIRTYDAVMVVIPNEVVLSEVIRNRTLAASGELAIVDITVPPIHDAAAAHAALRAAGVAATDLLDPAADAPTVIVLAMRADGIVLRFRARAKNTAAALALGMRVREAAARAIFGEV